MPVAQRQLTILLEPDAMVEDRIMMDPAVCHGKPCIRGTRVLVTVVLDAIAAGHTPEEVAADYPPLTVADVEAAMRFAAQVLEGISGNGH